MAQSTHVRRPVAPDDHPGAVDTRRIRDTDPAGPRGGRPSRIGTRAHPDVTEDGHLLAGGDVLVAAMTSPDWVTTMRHASALVTDAGGSTCLAAIVSRELGLPAIVGTRTAHRP